MIRVILTTLKVVSVLTLYILISSCGEKGDPTLEVEMPITEFYLLPKKGFTCTDISTGATEGSIGIPSFEINTIRIKWQNVKDNLNVSFIRIYTKDETVEGTECIVDGAELAWLAKGLDPSIYGMAVTVATRASLDVPMSSSPCKIVCSGYKFKENVLPHGISLTIEVYGADTSKSPKPVKGTASAVLLPAL